MGLKRSLKKWVKNLKKGLILYPTEILNTKLYIHGVGIQFKEACRWPWWQLQWLRKMTTANRSSRNVWRRFIRKNRVSKLRIQGVRNRCTQCVFDEFNMIRLCGFQHLKDNLISDLMISLLFTKSYRGLRSLQIKKTTPFLRDPFLINGERFDMPTVLSRFRFFDVKFY